MRNSKIPTGTIHRSFITSTCLALSTRPSSCLTTSARCICTTCTGCTTSTVKRVSYTVISTASRRRTTAAATSWQPRRASTRQWQSGLPASQYTTRSPGRPSSSTTSACYSCRRSRKSCSPRRASSSRAAASSRCLTAACSLLGMPTFLSVAINSIEA